MTKAYRNIKVKSSLMFEPMPSFEVQKGCNFVVGKRLSVIGEEFETDDFTIKKERKISRTRKESAQKEYRSS